MNKRKSLFAVVASAAVMLGAVLTLLSPARALTNCSVFAEDQAVDAEEHQMLVLINQFRQELGLNPLSLDPDVTRAAAWFSRDMATKNYFPPNHVDSYGRYIPTRLAQCDVSFVNWAENIAAGKESAEETFEQWVDSVPHNANMRNPNVSLAGIARAFNESSTSDWYWTLDLTSPGSGSTTTAPPGSTTSTTSGPPTSTTTTSTLPGATTTTLAGPTTTITFPGTIPLPTFPSLPTTTIPTGGPVPTSTTTTSSSSTTVPLPTSTTIPLPAASAPCDQLDELRSEFDASLDEVFDEAEALVRRELSGAQEEAVLALLAQYRASGDTPFDGFEAFCNGEAGA